MSNWKFSDLFWVKGETVIESIVTGCGVNHHEMTVTKYKENILTKERIELSKTRWVEDKPQTKN